MSGIGWHWADTIATVFSKRSLMDKRGTGILRMNKFCDEYNLAHPVFAEQTGYFGIVFKNPGLLY